MSNKEPAIRIAIDVPFSTVEQLEKYAKKMGMKRSQAIRSILVQFFTDKKE